jgi:hypothetical protein
VSWFHVTLVEVVEELRSFDVDGTIYAAEPWTRVSEAQVVPSSDSIQPLSRGETTLSYFLEVFIARDFLADWMAGLDRKPPATEACDRLIGYAVNDA